MSQIDPADGSALPPASAGMLAPHVPESLLRRLGGLMRDGRRAERQILPLARLAGPMPWVIAIMVALTVIAAAGGMALRNMAGTARAELAGGITVQILDSRPEARERQAAASVAALAATPGVGAVRRVPQAEVDRLIAPWLGGDQASGEADGGAVPVPALIDAHVDGPVDAARLAAIATRLRAVAPSARADAQATWLRPVFAAIASLQWLAALLVALLAAALAASVLLAARTALGNHRATIEIVHMLGGTDAQIAGIFQRAIGTDAAVGGAVGLIVGLLAIAVLGGQMAALDAGIVSGGALGWTSWLVLALVPVAGVVLATLTARLSVLSALRKML